ncbi:MAG: glycosyltransferase [Planctomycetia bacterium]
MGTLCLIKGHKPLISETFIDTHIQRLAGEKVVLYNDFPNYTYNGRTLRYFHSRQPGLAKLKRLLPVFLYDRMVTRHELSNDRTMDFMAGFFRQHNVDVILAEYGFNGADIAPVAKSLGIPLVVHFHGHDAHREPEISAYRDQYRLMFQYAYRYLSVSHYMTQAMLELGADPQRIVYNPYGAREYFFDVQPDYRPTLIAVGRFADIKAPYLTLAAFQLIAKDNPDARLVMVGDGPLLECCRSLARTWNLESQVSFPGALVHEHFLPLLSQARAFVQHSVVTSYRDAEGTPNSILEAQAAGLPVLSTRHAGINEAVVHGETGFLVIERDINAMASLMQELLRDEALCRRMGAAGRGHIRQNYNISKHIDVLQQTIHTAVSGH